jgi:hypothetical protein
MATLLHIDSSPLCGRSVSRELTAAFVTLLSFSETRFGAPKNGSRRGEDDLLDPSPARGERDWTRHEAYGGARAIVEANGGGYGMGLADARDMIHPV